MNLALSIWEKKKISCPSKELKIMMMMIKSIMFWATWCITLKTLGGPDLIMPPIKLNSLHYMIQQFFRIKNDTYQNYQMHVQECSQKHNQQQPQIKPWYSPRLKWAQFHESHRARDAACWQDGSLQNGENEPSTAWPSVFAPYKQCWAIAARNKRKHTL